MNTYIVIAGTVRYALRAKCLSHAVAFTKHWPNVRIMRARVVAS